MSHRLLDASRNLAWIPVVFSILGALALAVAGAIETIHACWSFFVTGAAAAGSGKSFALKLIVTADLFLIATALLIIGLGLYTLLLDDSLELPDSLRVHSVYDLKDKLINVVVVVLSVFFLGEAVEAGCAPELAWLGGSTAAMIAALAYFISRRPGQPGRAEATDVE